MSQRTRYQEGNIVRVRRSRVPDYWALRWWETDAEGKRIRRKAVIGPVSEYPSRITLDIYTQAMSPEKRRAQTRVAKMFLKRDGKKSPKTANGRKLLLDPKGPQ